MISPLGKHQPRALVVGLRRVMKDPKSTATQVLKACELLAILEGYIGGRPVEPSAVRGDAAKSTQCLPSSRPSSEANAKRIRELIAMVQEKKTD